MTLARLSLGKDGERIAENFLKQHGCKIVQRNYRCPVGELDLIVIDRGVIVFVEVKTRSGMGFGSPLEAVAFHKQRKLIQAAQYFLNDNKIFQRDLRFDVVGITWVNNKPEVLHVKNAFDAT